MRKSPKDELSIAYPVSFIYEVDKFAMVPMIRTKSSRYFRRRIDFRQSESSRISQHRRWMRQWKREINEINGIAFAGMPGSFPGRNEGEPFHVRCGLNLLLLLLAPELSPGAARPLVYTVSRACGPMYQWERSVASSHGWKSPSRWTATDQSQFVINVPYIWYTYIS